MLKLADDEEEIPRESLKESRIDSNDVTQWIQKCLCLIILALLFAILNIVLYDEELTGLSNFQAPTGMSHSKKDFHPKKLLYIVTSSSDINRKKTMKFHDRDRLMSVVVPVMKESIKSMQESGFDVDLYMIISYNLTQDRRASVNESLPEGVQLEVWEDATPIDYDIGGRKPDTAEKVGTIGRTLSRQHRFVVRDKLMKYDMFLAFEDDMLVTGEHITHYLHLSQKLSNFRQQSPEKLPGINAGSQWYGPMKKIQLQRMKPGFIRVEALRPEFQNLTQEEKDIESNIPIDFDFSDLGYNEKQSFDPSICCHVNYIGMNGTTAHPTPQSSHLMLWETGIAAIGVRELPDGSWVALLPGPRKTSVSDKFEHQVGKFIAHMSRKMKEKPALLNPKFMAQSAGWMMTRDEILELHIDICNAPFLPPFDEPFRRDGLYMNNVEFWSGGLQMWCPKDGCSIQRVIQLDPKNFSKHLLYHTANNKQQQITRQRRVRVENFLGQLNTVRKDAIKEKVKQGAEGK